MNKKNSLILILLVFLILLSIAAAIILSMKPEETFTPNALESVSSSEWTEKEHDTVPAVDNNITETPESSPQSHQGNVQDTTQQIIYEDETHTTTSLSGSDKETDQNTKPSSPPSTDSDLKDPDVITTYPKEPSSVTQTVEIPETTPSSDNGSENKPSEPSEASGSVYDPVLGWITVAPSKQEVIDSDGDINKQVGTMGN